mgnify:FL=1
MTMTDERLAELDAVMAKAMPTKIWYCKVGEVASVPVAADPPMREAVENAYYAITGEYPTFVFSGWGAELTEPERAVVENRLPADTSTFYDNEPIQSQVDRLAEYIMREAPDAINGGGAIETAISIISAQAATIARAIAIIEHCDVTEGVCCCGDDMDTHAEPMSCGHSPVDHGSYTASQWLDEARATLTGAA